MAAHIPKKPSKVKLPDPRPSPQAGPVPVVAQDDDGFSVYFLDMGNERYGDSMLLRMGQTTIMIDGGHAKDYISNRWPDHPSIPDQLAKILGIQAPFPISLLVVTHAHSDHIGCLPTLVRNGTIKPEFALVCDPDLGWGRVGGAAPDSGVSDAAKRMAAALREESRIDESDSAVLADFIEDAVSLEPGYRQMLKDLAAMQTVVARFGKDDEIVQQIVTQFRETGLEILGPSQDQLDRCARQINASSRATHQGSDAFLRSNADAIQDEVEAYRILAAGRADSADGAPAGSSGPCINDQSIVLKFNYQGKALFFSGDMQLSEPQFNGVDDDMDALRKKIADAGPYSLVKFPHHGSFNGISPEIFEAFESKFFGLCAGIGDSGHPSSQALEILKEHADSIIWARTDKNGMVAFHSKRDAWDVEVSEGATNDDSPNTRQDAVPQAIPPAPLSVPPRLPEEQDVIRVTAHVPKRATRVTVTVDLQPQEVAARPPFPVAAHRPKSRDAGILVGMGARAIAGGRKLPKILFVTNKTALTQSVNDGGGVAALLQQLIAAGHGVFDALPPGPAVANADAVRQQIHLLKPTAVVIIGGYDVVPPAVVDVLDAPLRQSLADPGADADNFIVWNDDIYADPDADGFPELPVSRIPDGRSLALLTASLSATNGTIGTTWRGLRNSMRPFADSVWAGVAGKQSLLQSAPVYPTQTPAADLAGQQVYLMLHGSDIDGTRFWGEQPGNYQMEAFNLSNIPARSPSVVFTGCCWGALVADGIASVSDAAAPPRPRTAANSIALRYLAGGATAFVGCTGSHYSPEPPGGFFGGPMHRSFWTYLADGNSPAQALLLAKSEFRVHMPHGLTEPQDKAIEKKILWQYTCLGLGW